MFEYYDIQVKLPESGMILVLNDISEWTRFKVKIMKNIPFISVSYIARYIISKCIVCSVVKPKDLLCLSHNDYIYLMTFTTERVMGTKE